LGFWNLLQHCCENPDDFLFLHDAFGYESLVANQNAAVAIPMLLADFDVDGYFTLVEGMDALPRTLAFHARLKSRQQCVIAQHHTVEAIERVADEDGAVAYKLHVRCTPSHDDDRISYEAEYIAKRVILALPQKALIALTFVGLPDAEFRQCLNTVTAHPAFKLFMLYDRPWWTQELSLQAKATTDLPIRQVYYLGDENCREGQTLVMASYSDEHYVDFWDPLVRDPAREREISRLKALGMRQRVDVSGYAASTRILNKAHAQLRNMHELATPPDPQFGVVKEWPEAWHLWNVHVEPWRVAASMVRPFGDLEIYTCGEAYSLEQGWTEGALKSAERVIQAIGGIGVPAWFKRDTNAEAEAVSITAESFAEYIEN
jgi:hypothetical protein